MERQEKLYSARDAVSTRALRELMSSIDAIPIRALKPAKNKGGQYLAHFHASTSTCFITRIPSNLIRALISYNTINELLALSLSCRQFSKFLFDKYIQFSGVLENFGLYRAPTFKFQDSFDMHRLEDLKNSGKKVKIFGSIRPEFTNIFYVSGKGDLFYSYHEGAILEGTLVSYADRMEIKVSRPCIPNVILTDVSGEAIACVSATQLALSLPDSLLQVTMASAEPAVAVYFLANKRMILVQKVCTFELYHITLELAEVLQHEGELWKLYLPDPAKPVFATLSIDLITTYLVTAEGSLRRKFRHERKPSDPYITDIFIHRQIEESEHYDFVILLHNHGDILINFKPVTSAGDWRQLYMCEGHLIAIKPHYVQVFSFSPDSKTYIPAHTLQADQLADPSFPTLLNCSRMKIASVLQQSTGLSISYYQVLTDQLKLYYEVQLPVEEAKVTFHRQVIFVKAALLKWKPKPVKNPPESVKEEQPGLVETVPCVYIVNFNVDSVIRGAPDLMSQEMAIIEERDRDKIRGQRLLEHEQQKKARKQEELENKPKYRH